MNMPGRFTQVNLSCGSERMKPTARWRFAAVGIGVLAFLTFIPTASAIAVGPFNEANCPGGEVTVSETSIVWATVGLVPGCIDTGAGTAVTYSGGTLGSGVTGSILALTAGGPSPVNDFMTFQGTTLDFVLTAFVTPSTTNGTNCSTTTSGQTCVVFAGSPFLLTNLGLAGTQISLSAEGTVTDGLVTSDWYGSFSTQLNIAPASIQSTEQGGGSISSTEAGQFTAYATPEPASWTMIGGGLIALAMAAKRRKTRA